MPAMRCEACRKGDPKIKMAPTPHMTRLLQGCGFEPRHPRAAPPVPAGYEGDVSVCPGYSTGLPEVAETVMFRPSWTKGYLAEHIGDAPTPVALDAQNALEGAINLKQRHDSEESVRRAKEGGGAR